jgi:septum formation protein
MSKLILASKSKARIEMLAKAGFRFEIIPADIDEAAVKKSYEGELPDLLAGELAFQKARRVSEQRPTDVVIGSDSLLFVAGQIMSKAKDKNDAKEKLKFLRNKTHRIISAVSVCKDGAEVWSHVGQSDLTMREFSDAFLDDYLEHAGDVLTTCVGAYALEDRGVRLFEKIEGDFFTILGMPLVPLLNYLEKEGMAA